MYDTDRRGYVVTRSPYGDDDEQYDDSAPADDLYVYPAKGQSEQQQADDRYECHRWAADQTHYDPLNDEYDADRRADYRARDDCLPDGPRLHGELRACRATVRCDWTVSSL